MGEETSSRFNRPCARVFQQSSPACRWLIKRPMRPGISGAEGSPATPRSTEGRSGPSGTSKKRGGYRASESRCSRRPSPEKSPLNLPRLLGVRKKPRRLRQADQRMLDGKWTRAKRVATVRRVRQRPQGSCGLATISARSTRRVPAGAAIMERRQLLPRPAGFGSSEGKQGIYGDLPAHSSKCASARSPWRGLNFSNVLAALSATSGVDEMADNTWSLRQSTACFCDWRRETRTWRGPPASVTFPVDPAPVSRPA